MPAARAGLYPGTLSNASFVTQKGNVKNVVHDNGTDWDLSSGWHYPRARGWRKTMSGSREKRQLVGTDGKAYTVYFYRDANRDSDTRIGFHAHSNEDTSAMALLKRAEFWFNDPENEAAVITEHSQSGGHISQLDYVEQDLLLRATFEDGTICVFDKVPHTIAGTLLFLMKRDITIGTHLSGTKRGEAKHAVGVRFWDYIRIRGQRHGARYPFEYESGPKSMLTNSRRRYTITLRNEKQARFVLGPRYDELKETHNFDFDKGVQVTSVLSNKEYNSLNRVGAKIINDIMIAKNVNEFSKMLKDANESIDNKDYYELYNRQYLRNKHNGMTDADANQHAIKEVYNRMLPNDAQSIRDKRQLALTLKPSLQGDKFIRSDTRKKLDQDIGVLKNQFKTLEQIKDNALETQSYTAYKKWSRSESSLGRRAAAAQTIGTFWTTQDLINATKFPEVANDARYNAHLQAKDWRNALERLKNINRVYEIKDNNGVKIDEVLRPVALKNDRLA